MEMNQVRYFLAVCAELNFTRAARRCGIAQPSLTRAIKLLEKELGDPLFIRGNRQSRLSELGLAVRRHLAQIDRCASQVRRKADELLAAHSQEVRNDGGARAHSHLRSGRDGRDPHRRDVRAHNSAGDRVAAIREPRDDRPVRTAIDR